MTMEHGQHDEHPYNSFEPYPTTENEPFMNDSQLAHFKKILENWRRSIMEGGDNTLHSLKEVDAVADPNDRATWEEAVNTQLKFGDRNRKLASLIEKALQRIKSKEYGYCNSCGMAIGIRRLEARPTATLCIDCKTIEEIKEKRSG